VLKCRYAHVAVLAASGAYDQAYERGGTSVRICGFMQMMKTEPCRLTPAGYARLMNWKVV
jgi:hypothetical protein